MWLIVGLGNPGRKYARTRHNVGFMVVDAAADRWGIRFSLSEARAHTAQGAFRGVPVLLAKPQTFMNRSGSAVAALLRQYRLAAEGLILVYDDLDLPVGRLRLRARGRSGGHHGVQSVIETIQTDAFLRLRIGIQEPHRPDDTVAYVLSEFSPEVRPVVDESIAQAVQALETVLGDGAAKAMSLFNSK